MNTLRPTFPLHTPGSFLLAASLALGVLGPVTPARAAPEAHVEELMSKDLLERPGDQGLMLLVTYPPGGVDHVHRHDAHAFVYVLEGSIVMQLRGSEPVTLRPGQTFYEGPHDVHVVGRNASNTVPAKFVVFFVKKKGAPVLTFVD